jgi:hypothetical protein
MVRVVRSSKKRSPGHVARMGRLELQYSGNVMREGIALEHLSVNGTIILEWILVDWIHLARDRDQWRAVVNTVMNLWVT